MGAKFRKGIEKVGKTSGVSGFDVPATALPHLPPRFKLAYWHSHIGNKVLV